MADDDPISDFTPARKRQKTSHGGVSPRSSSGDEFASDDFNTVATLALTSQKRKLVYPADRFHADLNGSTNNLSTQFPQSRHITQPTQALDTSEFFHSAVTQPTQLLAPRPMTPSASDVLVGRSSPPLPSDPSPSQKTLPPQPIRRAPFAKPSFLASAMAPPGTSFRRPLGVQPRPSISAMEDDDAEEDPPVHYSSGDEETQSALKPTNFKRGGRDLDSTPTRSNPIVRESPRQPSAPAGTGGSVFLNLMSEFGYQHNYSAKSDDMSNSYASNNRRPRPLLATSNRPQQTSNAIQYKTLDDVQDYDLRRKVIEIQRALAFETVQRCMDALAKNKSNVDDAASWLAESMAGNEDKKSGEDSSEQAPSAMRRGVAISKPQSQILQSRLTTTKAQVRAPTMTIAEKYKAKTTAAKASQQDKDAAADEEEVVIFQEVRPRRRLLQGRRTVSREHSSSPPVKEPIPPAPRPKAKNVVLSDDSDEEADVTKEVVEEVTTSEVDHDRRLLHFFNECSVRDVVDLCNQPEAAVQAVLDKRPFNSLDAIRAITTTTTETKSDKRSKARPIGDKIVDICSEVRIGFEAVEELVDGCEDMAKPIQSTLKSWGVGASDDGELQLMKLDEAHDSGIGTPASSCSPDYAVQTTKEKPNFLAQPQSMNTDMTLKDYQLVGLNWLNLLWSKEISCILADDMGLGKTCQIIAFLAHLQEQKVTGVHLVIVPGSTLENWLREFARFAPKLQVRPYYGSQNERAELRASIEDDFDEIDVVITTYDIAVKPVDHKFLRKRVDPLVTVYDEAHSLRNTQTQRYSQLLRIPATFRVLLTGTPLQNNLQELVAILAFIMPELFNAKKAELQYLFQHKASTKDSDHAALLSSQRIARARAMITPFILRRKKHQVLELPAKHRRVEYCDMTPTQASYYADMFAEAQRVYQDRLDGKTKVASNAKGSSTTLMALREAAIHPLLRLRLYDDRKLGKIATELLKREWADNPREMVMSYLRGEHHQSFKGGDFGMHKFCAERADYLSRFMLRPEVWMDSGKVAVFKDLINTFTAIGDRTLVFSQFTTLLDILEAVLGTLGVRFVRLDGSTDMNTRQDLIDTFTNDTSISVFLLSTRAGGAGLNLAAANKVIIFDAGFNPQDDVQAENRAHRVGQTRPVEVVRLVSRGTIEEQMLALGESKLALDERVSNGETSGDGTPTERGKSQDTTAVDGLEESRGQKKVEEMFLKSLEAKVSSQEVKEKEKKKKPATAAPAAARAGQMDLKYAFQAGLSKAGVSVKSKQAQF